MSELEERFKKAAEEAMMLPTQDSDTMLKLYAYYKQSTSGDVSGKRPGMTDLRGRAKYDAWTKVKGTSREGAMQAYIALIEKIKK
jgi:acyl-CoA-binding protein